MLDPIAAARSLARPVRGREPGLGGQVRVVMPSAGPEPEPEPDAPGTVPRLSLSCWATAAVYCGRPVLLEEVVVGVCV